MIMACPAFIIGSTMYLSFHLASAMIYCREAGRTFVPGRT